MMWLWVCIKYFFEYATDESGDERLMPTESRNFVNVLAVLISRFA